MPVCGRPAGGVRLRRDGLTLMELVIVLVILVAIAGIVVPLMPNILDRAHSSTGAANLGDVSRLVLSYKGLHHQYPNDLDALLSAGSPAIPDYVPTGGGSLAVMPLSPAQAAALNACGITRLAEMQASRSAFAATNSPTFNPYTGALMAVGSGTNVVRVDESAIEGIRGLVGDDPGNTG